MDQISADFRVLVEQRPFVVIESPYRSDTTKGLIRNHNYAKAVLNHSIELGESPFISHLFYTQFLNDKLADQRLAGMSAGWALLSKADYVVAYLDLGWSDGMVEGIEKAARLGLKVERRRIGWPLRSKI